jgi:Protein of unknown function (DUF3134)
MAAKYYHNPALHEEPRNQPIKIPPLKSRESLLSWLESTGRFQVSEIIDLQDQKVPEDLDDILGSEIYADEEDDEQQD